MVEYNFWSQMVLVWILGPTVLKCNLKKGFYFLCASVSKSMKRKWSYLTVNCSDVLLHGSEANKLRFESYFLLCCYTTCPIFWIALNYKLPQGDYTYTSNIFSILKGRKSPNLYQIIILSVPKLRAWRNQYCVCSFFLILFIANLDKLKYKWKFLCSP